MNNQKNVFTIKDLENLSGIKAHTIRIWEKRYNVLEPMRTDTNIRVYNTHNLQKLLNICTLHSFGYKISTIAKISDEKLPVMVREILSSKTINSHVLSNFKLAMMNFDQPLFLNTYNSLLNEKPFREIFYECFIPLLEEIGMLWQTDTITPAHEHFISNLIKQKIIANTEKLHLHPPVKTDRIYVLYLPEGEIHEIGLMLLNYELLLNGNRTIYLGESVPMNDIKDIKSYFDNITYITYITVEPANGEVNRYVERFSNEIITDDHTHLYIFGRLAASVSKSLQSEAVRTFEKTKDFIEML
jgi:methanogenic corrinoid protein MtbC1